MCTIGSTSRADSILLLFVTWVSMTTSDDDDALRKERKCRARRGFRFESVETTEAVCNLARVQKLRPRRERLPG